VGVLNHHQLQQVGFHDSLLDVLFFCLLEEEKRKATDKADAEKAKEESSKKSTDTSGPAPSKAPSVPATPKGPHRETPTSQISVTPARQQTSIASGTDPNKITGTRSETRVKMSRMRLRIAERLKEAQNTCAMLTTFNEIDMR
jgi:2-oxoglutarate dehydrogenase E2 component (dihydrolipoamide succinyltransferase)